MWGVDPHPHPHPHPDQAARATHRSKRKVDLLTTCTAEALGLQIALVRLPPRFLALLLPLSRIAA